MYSHGSLKARTFLAIVRERCDYKRKAQRDVNLLALKMEEGATSQGMQAASRNWKRQKNRSSPRASRREGRSADILILAQ